MANAKGSCKKHKYKDESRHVCWAAETFRETAFREGHFEWHHLQGPLPSWQQGCGCALWGTAAPHGKVQQPHWEEQGSVLGQGNHHTGDSGLPHAMDHVIRVNCFILFHHVAGCWRQKGLAGTMGNFISNPKHSLVLVLWRKPTLPQPKPAHSPLLIPHHLCHA